MILKTKNQLTILMKIFTEKVVLFFGSILLLISVFFIVVIERIGRFIGGK